MLGTGDGATTETSVLLSDTRRVGDLPLGPKNSQGSGEESSKEWREPPPEDCSRGHPVTHAGSDVVARGPRCRETSVANPGNACERISDATHPERQAEIRSQIAEVEQQMRDGGHHMTKYHVTLCGPDPEAVGDLVRVHGIRVFRETLKEQTLGSRVHAVADEATIQRLLDAGYEVERHEEQVQRLQRHVPMD